MAQRNRVTPTGDIVATSLRGAWMGNRGCLHEGRDIVRAWRSKAWITCRTDFKDRRVEQWVPGRYTVLFFHDEAVALAAGHRPCAECRHGDYQRFLDAWEQAHGSRPSARELDAALHESRLAGRRQATHQADWVDLPVGTFVHRGASPAVVTRTAVVPWSPTHGYRTGRSRPTTGEVTVLTPAVTVATLRAGYVPQLGT